MSIHAVKRAQAHLAWDNSIPPVARISSGDTVSFDCLDASNGQISPASTASTVGAVDLASVDQVNGPVFVAGAEPGDTLQVDVLALAPANWGWTALIPGFGLLADEFPAPALKLWALDDDEGKGTDIDVGTGTGTGTGVAAWFDEARGIRVPLRPFAGEMGVARGENGAFSTVPPYRTGGNLDTKHVTAGSTLYLPVEVEGALFSMGDGHAAQGDGEVCGTAIETPIRATVRLTVLKDKPVAAPHFRTAPVSTPANEQYYATTGVGPDLREAARDATRGMIEYLGTTHGLGREDAYMLCSVAADLRLHEVVDMPNYVVGMMLPKSIFVGRQL